MGRDEGIYRALTCLSKDDIQLVEVAKRLAKALHQAAQVPPLVSCQFKVAGYPYKALLTAPHRNVAQQAAKQYPHDPDKVTAALVKLLGKVEKPAGIALTALRKALRAGHKPVQQGTDPTGACFFKGGACQEGVTEHTCNSLKNWDHWVEGGSCSEKPPPRYD
jgi:hypothetical protein